MSRHRRSWRARLTNSLLFHDAQSDEPRPGTRLGNLQIAAAQAKGTASTKAAADQFASGVLPFILPLKAQRASLRKIAEAPSECGIELARGA